MNQQKRTKLAAKAERVPQTKFTAVASMIQRYLTQERIKEITDKARQQTIENINWMTPEERISIKKKIWTKKKKKDVPMGNGIYQTKRREKRKYEHLGTDNLKIMP